VFNAITDVQGIKVGHYTNLEAATGCTVILAEKGAIGGVDVRGAAPGTRETELLRPLHLVQEVHAVLLSGGSAFGLDAAGGVMRYLEERGVGYNTLVAMVPIVPAAILYDLAIGDPKVRPDAASGYAACLAASGGLVDEGNVGAGTGATVGKMMGTLWSMKGGLGTASQRVGGKYIVGAIVAVNAFGDVVDPRCGHIIAGARRDEYGRFLRTEEELRRGRHGTPMPLANTTIGVVATNAPLTKDQANKVAQMAHDGLAMSIRPVHTMFDGDTIFALSTAKRQRKAVDVSAVGAVAAQVVAKAVVRAVEQAETLHGIPAARDCRQTTALGGS